MLLLAPGELVCSLPRNLTQDYQEHQNEIHSKLVAIMGERLKEHIKSLKVGVCCSAARSVDKAIANA